MTDGVYEKVEALIQACLGSPLLGVSPDAYLYSLGLDEIDRVNLAFDIENEYSINFSNDDIDQWSSVQSVIDSIERKLIAE